MKGYMSTRCRFVESQVQACGGSADSSQEGSCVQRGPWVLYAIGLFTGPVAAAVVRYGVGRACVSGEGELPGSTRQLRHSGPSEDGEERGSVAAGLSQVDTLSRSGMPVAVPGSWDELLQKALDPNQAGSRYLLADGVTM